MSRHDKKPIERVSGEADLISQVASLKRAVQALERRLYRDNGVLSVQTRLDRLTQAHSQNMWFIRAISGALLIHILVGVLL